MKHYTKRLGMMAIGALMATSSIYAFKSEPGSSNDPLVTKSYVDTEIQKVKNGQSGNTFEIDEQVKVQAQLIDILKQQIDGLSQQVAGLDQTGGSTYEVVTVPKGSTLLGKQGSEVIIRSGDGVVVGSEGGGLQDMTAGVDIAHQSAAPKYHLIIIPREDGRGLYASTDLIVMVRGGYSIQKAN
ncbi:MAG: hypothetical protein ACRCTE_10265 [Cellulosilyticaceae bacterium]